MTALLVTPVPDLPAVAPVRRLRARAQLLAVATLGYNSLEAVVALVVAAGSGSIALRGFGLDAAVEFSSGLVVLWLLVARIPQQRERMAQRLIALSFLALAGYVAVNSFTALLWGHAVQVSGTGIVLASVSAVLMPVLARAKRRTGLALGSGAVVADGAQTMLCGWMSVSLLAGLALHAAFGWTWADPVAGLLIALLAAREGVAAWRGHHCCSTAH